MITKITQDLLTSKRNRPGTKCEIRKGIVIHYTANTSKGANAKRNRDYFNTTTTYASTQFIECKRQHETTIIHTNQVQPTKLLYSLRDKGQGLKPPWDLAVQLAS